MQDVELTPGERRSKLRNVLIVAAAYTAGALLYKFVFFENLGHTSLMFIGVPGILAVLLALAPKPGTAKGSIIKGVTFALLLVAPLLGEGYLCILMASPLFYAIGLAVGAAFDHQREGDRALRLSLASVVLLLFSLEGVVPAFTHSRTETVTVTRDIAAPADRIAATLAQSPDITTPLPRFLRIGFPRPLAATGSGLAPGSPRAIHFAGAEGDPPGDLIMRVAESTPGHLRFTTISDTSKLTQWVRWQSSDITWTPLDATHTRLTWATTFERQLDPWWYFTPWERHAVREATNYLIRSNATPR